MGKSKYTINEEGRECIKCKYFKEWDKFVAGNGPNKKKNTCKSCMSLYQAIIHNRNKWAVIIHYGRVCSCCKESQIAFLTLDHINGGGNKHRKEVTGSKAGGTTFYAWIIKENFPEGYQVLCWNCNAGREVNRGICPHKDQW